MEDGKSVYRKGGKYPYRAYGKCPYREGGKSPCHLHFADATPIRARAGHPKIAALKTYGGLREFLKKELGQGKSFEAVGKELQVSGSRISEFVNILGIERKGKGKGDLGICVDRPTIGPDGEFKMEAPREPKGKDKTKKLPNGDVLTRI